MTNDSTVNLIINKYSFFFGNLNNHFKLRNNKTINCNIKYMDIIKYHRLFEQSNKE